MTARLEAQPLLASLQDLLERANGERRLVSVTVEVEVADPAAAVFASRLAADRWFCWEQPDNDGFALAGLGAAHEAVSRGLERFEDVVRACAELSRDRLADEPDELPAGAGPVWAGGFAFDPDGGSSGRWSSYPPALMALPELSLQRHGDRTLMTVAAVATEDAEALLARLAARISSLRLEPLPLSDPHPTEAVRITGSGAPSSYEHAVEAAVARIRDGKLRKTVLARDVTIRAGSAHDPAAVFGALREVFPSCFCFCCGSPEGAFLGASPELLIRRRGAGAATVALAGSTGRSADPAVDDHLGERLLRSAKNRGEQAIVVERIERLLRPHAVWVAAEPEPELAKVANIQHLATPIRAQLAEPRSAVDLAGILHPTPAVGGEPREMALAAIAELEDLDRGWYAGPIGWMDAAEDGDFCVGLRSALLRDRDAHLYAGAGIVAGSDPEAELAETELKLAALLPLLAG